VCLTLTLTLWSLTLTLTLSLTRSGSRWKEVVDELEEVVDEVEEVVEEEELEMVDVVRDVLAIKVRCSMHSLASVRRTAVQSCSVLAPVARGMHW
jgi:hypothetical protein